MSPESSQCRPGQLKCEDRSSCFGEEQKCDGYRNCADNKDETNCRCTKDNCRSPLICQDDKCLVPGFTKEKDKWCDPYYGSSPTLTTAIQECINNRECIGMYDDSCDDQGFHFCRSIQDITTSGSASCIYKKLEVQCRHNDRKPKVQDCADCTKFYGNSYCNSQDCGLVQNGTTLNCIKKQAYNGAFNKSHVFRTTDRLPTTRPLNNGFT